MNTILVENQLIKAKWGTRNKKWYEKSGYTFTGKSTEFRVDIKHLNHSSQELVRFKCDICGTECENIMKYIMDNRKQRNSNIDYCLKCSQESSTNKRKLSYKYVYDYFKKNNCELLESEYINNLTKMRYICSCGEESSIDWSAFKQGTRCMSCLFNRKKTVILSYEYVKNFFKESGCELLSQEYLGNNKELEFKCFCGKVSTIIFNTFMYSKQCRDCGLEKTANARRLDYDHVKKTFEENGCELISQEYINNTEPLVFRCSCGSLDKVFFYNFQNGSRCLDCVYKKKVAVCKARSGEKHHTFGIAKKKKRVIRRDSPLYCKWRMNVFKRDNFTCQCCFIRDKNNEINAHHLDGYEWCLDKRTDINNGISLCELCHNDFHTIYGRGGNTKEQWVEYMDQIYKNSPTFNLI